MTKQGDELIHIEIHGCKHLLTPNEASLLDDQIRAEQSRVWRAEMLADSAKIRQRGTLSPERLKVLDALDSMMKEG